MEVTGRPNGQRCVSVARSPRTSSTQHFASAQAGSWYGLDVLEPRILLDADLEVGVGGTGIEGARYLHGDVVNATATIVNSGFPGSGPFNMQFWLSRVGGATRFELLETDRVSVGILPGGSRTNFLNGGLGYVLPDTLAFGSYRITAFVDTSNEVDESDESNNSDSSNSFRIIGPDLVVREIGGVQSFYDTGGLINASVLIANDGDTLTNTGTFRLKYFLSTANNPTFMLMEEAFVLNVLQGVTTTDSLNIPGFRIPIDIPQGEYHITVFLDTEGQVKELSESNNIATSQSFIIGGPDLSVPTVELANPTKVHAYGDLLNATALIENIGLGSTFQHAPLGFNVDFFLGAVNATTDAQRMLVPLQSTLVLQLDGGASTTRNVLQLLLPAGFAPGEYRVWVNADANNEVTETNESNNWGSSDVLTIQGARWEDEAGNLIEGEVEEATPVLLAIYSDQVSTSTNIAVDIIEDDVLPGANDLLEEVTLKHVASPGGHKWQRRWIPYRVGDQSAGEKGAPEYFFRVQNPDHLPGLFDASQSIDLVPHPGDFGVLLVEHTVGTGVPLVLVHGNESEEAPDLYRWKGMLDWIEDNPQLFAEFDVYLWKHDTEKPVGFNGAAGSQADGLAKFIYNDLGVGKPGQYENAKVALVAHSQGGLVSRGLMNTFNAQRGHLQGEDVSALITLGTPHHGSPFGTEDWLAVLWADLFNGLNEVGFNLLRDRFLQRGDGDLNLAWDNMDGVVDQAFPAGFFFDPDAFVLTPRDTNSVNSFADPTVVYLDSLKAAFGTLAALNASDDYLHKLITIGAYDEDLSDNMSPQELSAALLTNQAIGRHEQLGAVANLMALMSGNQLGNDNPSAYFANDGLVPLQSALLLNLPETGLTVSLIDAAKKVTLLPSQIDSFAPRDVERFIYSTADGIQDHVDLLDTKNEEYWQKMTDRLRLVLESIAPTAALINPGESASIDAGALNDRRFIDISFADSGGSTLDPLSILDAAPEFTVTGPGAVGVRFSEAPTRLTSGDHVYRYSFTGNFTPGDVQLHFIAHSFADDAGNMNAADTSNFIVQGDAVDTPLAYGISDSGDHFGTIDLGTGAFSLIGQLRSADGATIFADIENLAIDPTNGILHGIDTGTLVTIDPATAIVTVIGDTGLSDVDALTFNAAGELFAIDATPAINPGQLNRIDKATGQATLLAQLLMPVPDELVAMGAIDPKLDGIAFDPATGDLIAAYSSYGSMSFMVRVEMNTGQILNIGPAGVDDIEDIAFGPGDVLYGVLGDTGAVHGQPSASHEGLVIIDLVTGHATPVGTFGDTPLFDNRWDFEGFAIERPIAPTPAPVAALSVVESFSAVASTPAAADVKTATIAETVAPTITPTIEAGPLAITVSAPDIELSGKDSFQFTVTYAAQAGIKGDTLGNRNIQVIGKRFRQFAKLVDNTDHEDGSITATYEITAPRKGWKASHASLFTIKLRAKSVRDMLGQSVRRAAVVGTFLVNVAAPVVYKKSSIALLAMHGSLHAHEPLRIDIELTSLKNPEHLLQSLPLQIVAGKKTRFKARLLAFVQTGENTWHASFEIAAPAAGWASLADALIRLEIKGKSRTPLRVFMR